MPKMLAAPPDDKATLDDLLTKLEGGPVRI